MFSGIGGFELGIDRATKGKWECIGFSEIDKYATQIYQRHFPKHRNYNDARKIRTEDLQTFDAFVGGFPCQTFSIAGKRKGFADARGTLFYEIARIVKAKKPKMLLLENVKGLLSHDSGNTFARILTIIWDLGYNAEWCVLNSKHYGVPQNRERVFIVGCLREECPTELFFKPKNSREYEEENRDEHIQTKISGTITSGYAKNPSDGTYIQVGDFRFDEGIRWRKEKIVPCLTSNMRNDSSPSNNIFIQSHSPRSGDPEKGGTGPLTSKEHCFTIDRTPHNDIMGSKIRRLTPTECELLQGFEKGYTEFGIENGEKVRISDTQRYKCLGNAVTVNVIEAIIKRMEEWTI